MIELYDEIKDDFSICSDEEEAKQLIKLYGKELAGKFLPEKYKYLLKDKVDV